MGRSTILAHCRWPFRLSLWLQKPLSDKDRLTCTGSTGKLTEFVRDRALFHVTVTKPYKQAFASGQNVHIGASDNPFFQFYEGARSYPVNDNGMMVNVKAVRWLRLVRDGLIAPHPGILPTIALEIAEHYVMLCRELIMEELRRDEFGSKPPSRQSCIYACDTLEEAKYWRDGIGDNGSSVCELSCTGTIHRADAGLLLGESEPLSVTRERGRRYWRGETSDQPNGKHFSWAMHGSSTSAFEPGPLDGLIQSSRRQVRRE